ncbi:Na+/H+ antiporter subunit E [Corticibacter populi]|uniref:Na+/H+ antiporter subunit E n=1 Tax=Corticibacter populi TaxID=1550736 RepID=UPI0030FECFEA
MKTWLRRIFPGPLLSVMLFGMWLMMTQSYSLANMVLAAILGFGVPIFSAKLRPRYVRVRRPLVILRLFAVVTIDAWHSGWAVMKVLLRRVGNEDTSEFVHVPLELRDPNGLAVLALITCITPGNAWGELSMDRSTLLLHVLDGKVEPEKVIRTVKERYERPLMEIFE